MIKLKENDENQMKERINFLLQNIANGNIMKILFNADSSAVKFYVKHIHVNYIQSNARFFLYANLLHRKFYEFIITENKPQIYDFLVSPKTKMIYYGGTCGFASLNDKYIYAIGGDIQTESNYNSILLMIMKI